ncbi:MAG: vitamin B12 dependent-methionine synthase activation domain-containing protein [Fimbriimonadaceae bacterium]|nr:vitamin B12 dependent-methionine synthase activation domain-containing protein [Fimbriimonadaceae bacterium]
MSEFAQEELVCTYDPLIALMSRFEHVKASGGAVDPFEGLAIEAVLQKHIVDGIKKNLESHLHRAMVDYTPLAIINDILLEGMKTVGELFGAGKMQLPFVLQSAEVMKVAVKVLEPHMEKTDGDQKGSILLATVAGDVHDIGKNLVDIILTNNGFRVVNLGIKQPINAILDAAEQHRCEVIGMSGLLVKSTLIMKENLQEMNARGLSRYPVILGGAALTRAYVEQDLRAIYHGQVFYAQDAFEGLRIMDGLAKSASASVAEGADVPEAEAVPVRTTSHRTDALRPELYVFDGTKSNVTAVADGPALPFYGSRTFTKFDIFELYRYINRIALFRGQWQFRKGAEMSNPEFNAWLAENVEPTFIQLQRELANVLQPKVVWGYFPCHSEGNDLIIYHEDAETERLRFTFPRQADQRRLCISDFFRTKDQPVDTVGFQIVTVGSAVSEYERTLFQQGDYQKYLYVHGMGVETAEALAEYWHQLVRRELQIDDQEPEEMRLLFSAKYHGARYSFGYPACPNLEDQAKLFELLDPARIGIELTEEFMLTPEQSTSAIVVHHPEAQYFNIR